MNYTNEQSEYINYNGPMNTKLLACAGSGKTRCIIARMDRLIKDKIFKIENTLMLTFSRLTKDDFIGKLVSYGAKYIKNNSVKTIDSFAKSLIDTDNSIDVSLLSYKFMKYLDNTPVESLKNNPKLSQIKIIFVDEAQDLNKTQYTIFVLLNCKLGVNINLIGDPNQTIFQFRGSSDKYLKEFKAREYKLTKNFRSHEAIVNFSKFLRPYNTTNVICTKGKNKCKPIMTFYEDEYCLENQIVTLLQDAKKNGIELSDFAILAPTRGRISSYGKSNGLCLVSNVLFKNGIPFKQFYSESTSNSSDSSGNGVKYCPEHGYVNVLTYMGSKGLEWKYVILIDADMCLINKRFFDNEKHDNDRYLLYVACSRAIDNMFIFSKVNIRDIGAEFRTNPWFSIIPTDIYDMNPYYEKHFMYPKINYTDMGNKERGIARIIDMMDEETLNNMSDLSSFETRKIVYKEQFYNDNYTELNSPSSCFLGKYVEALFHSLCDIKYKRNHMKNCDIVNVIDSVIDKSVLITNPPMDVIMWFNNNKLNITWDIFDNDDTIDKTVKDYINKHFSRNREISEHTIISDNNIFKIMVLSERDWIRKVYQNYMECDNPYKMRKYVFDMTVIAHAFDTQHYYYIKNRGEKFLPILKIYDNMFNEMEKYIEVMKFKFINNNKVLTKWGIRGEVDVYDDGGRLWEIKCTEDISLRHYLQVLMYNIIHHNLDETQHPKCKLRFINLLKGEIIYFSVTIPKNNVIKIVDTFQKVGNIIIEINPENITTSTGQLIK